MTEEEQLEYEGGLLLAQHVIAAPAFANKLFFLQEAMKLLKPVSAPEKECPKAAFSIGLLAHHMGMFNLTNDELTEEEKLRDSAQFFAQAARYFEQAASMPDYQNDLTPARAKDTLAQLHEQGIINNGAKDLNKAFSLRHSAAESGFAEAQLNLALMYYRGEGTAPSLIDAYKWMSEALKNQSQLSSEIRTEVAAMHAQLDTAVQQRASVKPQRLKGPVPH